MVLQRAPASRRPPAGKRAIAYGLNWTLGMQSRERRLRARSTPTTRTPFWNAIPFADMEAMIDPPTEDITGRAARADGQRSATAPTSAARGARSSSCGGRSAPTARGGDAGASTSSTARGRCSPGSRAIGEDMQAPYVRRAVDWLDGAPERRRRLRRDGRVVRRRDARRAGREHAVADRVGGPRPARRPTGRARADRARRRVARADAERRRHVGRAAVHRHRIPAPLLPPLPHVPALLPADGARPVPARALRGRRR